MNRFSDAYIKKMRKAFDEFPHKQFEEMVNIFLKALMEKKTIFVMGNGGSGATASHWACDMNKGCSFQNDKRFKMICLNDNIPTLLAYANDICYEDVFLEQLKNFLNKDDIVIGISTSGNSKNVIKAIEYAKSMEAITIGLVGYSGGKLIKLVKVAVHIPVEDVQIVEEVHLMVAHMTMQCVLEKIGRTQSFKEKTILKSS